MRFFLFTFLNRYDIIENGEFYIYIWKVEI